MASKPHALIIPYPFQGHINPAVHLSITLASRGFTITFVNTEAVHHKTSLASSTSSPNPFANANLSGLDIRYEVISDGLPVKFDRSLNHDQFQNSLLHVSGAYVEELLMVRLKGMMPRVSVLIADTFFVWPEKVARKMGIPHVSYWTEPAIIFSLYYHVGLLRDHGHFASRENRKDTITYIPGVPAIKPTDLTSYLQDTDITSVVHEIIFKAFDSARKADFILCNTVQDLEPLTVAALNSHTPFYAIGPVFLTQQSTVATSMWAESDCTTWLDSHPPASVLYVSFGSYAHVGKRQLCEIAHGILDSQVSFIWVLRPDIVSSDEPDPLPPMFEELTRGRGIVVPWCRQVEVLSHVSIGGFLTHCGWNSVLEGIWCGVPLLCFPLVTDQVTNRKLVVSDWRIGLDGGHIDRADRVKVSERIQALMGGQEGEEVRTEIKNVKVKLEKAVEPDGSSQKNLDRFIEDLTAHLTQRNMNGPSC